jgi:hypothetical protein
MFENYSKLYSLPFVSFLTTLFTNFTYEVKKKAEYIKTLALATKSYAFHLAWFAPTNSFRYTLYAHGVTWAKRRAVTEEYAVDLIIVFLLAAILFPIAQNQLVNATTTNWNNAVIVMFEVLLPILVVVTLVRHFT